MTLPAEKYQESFKNLTESAKNMDNWCPTMEGMT